MTSGIVNLDFPLEFCLGEPRQRPRGNHQSDEDEDPDSGSKREDPDSGSKRRGTSVGKKDAKKKKKDEEKQQQQRPAPVEARREPPPGSFADLLFVFDAGRL